MSERAHAHGFALVGVNNIWMSGGSAYYVEMAARAGLIAVAAPPTVAPLGGAKAALGTNPIALGFPLEGDPLVIDLGTSAFMGTDLQFRQRPARGGYARRLRRCPGCGLLDRPLVRAVRRRPRVAEVT